MQHPSNNQNQVQKTCIHCTDPEKNPYFLPAVISTTLLIISLGINVGLISSNKKLQDELIVGTLTLLPHEIESFNIIPEDAKVPSAVVQRKD